MRKKLLNEKREQLKGLPRRELIDRICNYHDQDLLNVDANGERRKFPVGDMATKIRDNHYQMSDKQYYTLIHHFSSITVPEMKIVGVSFYDNKPAEFEKTLIQRDGSFSVWETDYVLRPEPTNEHDPNAVMVLAHKEDGSLHHMGYLAREFVAAHPITEEMEIHGYIKDWSNGKFKMVSYQTALDTEDLDNKQRNRHIYTDADLNGIGDLGLDKPDVSSIKSTIHVYERPFTLSNPVTYMEDAEQYLNSLGLRSDMADEFTTRGLEDNLTNASYRLLSPTEGVVHIETDGELSEEQSLIANAYIRHLHSDGYIATGLKQQDFIDVPYYQTTFNDPSYAHFLEKDGPVLTVTELEIESEKGELNMEKHVYATYFELTYPVNDYEAAKAYLLKDDMTDYLKDHIQYKIECGDYTGADFSDAVANIKWDLWDEQSGETILIANRELTSEELSAVSEWVSGQNSDGLGEGFEQQPFACYEDEDYADDEEFDDNEVIMASFDWDKNDYPFKDVTNEYSHLLDAPLTEEDLSFGEVPEAEDVKTPTLTDADLEFAQMDLSEFGLY